MGKKLDLALGVLNGAVGDYLVRTRNDLATPMGCYLAGAPIALTRAGLAAAYPAATPHITVLVHGLMCTESVWELPDGSDYGSLLARDLGTTPVYVRYNSGRAIPDSGAALADLLDALIGAWPVAVREIVPIGYSMGGLVVRAATHVAATREAPGFLPLVRRAIYVGTPHQGAPLERAGRVATRLLESIDDPIVRLIADLANLRSDGVKDLGDADLRHVDRERRTHRFSLRDARHPVPLLPRIEHHLVAGSLADPRLAAFFGDSVVPVPSGTDGHCIDAATRESPPAHVAYVPGLDHIALAHHPRVYEHIRGWLDATIAREETACPV